MRRNVVLIYPNAGQDVLGINVGLPLSILYVGTALKDAGYDVTILDERVHTNFKALLKEAIASDPVYVGISSMTGYQISYGLLIAQTIRDLNPRIPIVWGGVHPTIHPESTARHRLVVIVVVNEGEETAVELAGVLAAGGDVRQVRGLAMKEDGRVVRTLDRPHLAHQTVADRHQPGMPIPLQLLLPDIAGPAGVSLGVGRAGV